MAQASESSWGASPEAIQSHYDVSNDFYSLWLDESRTYSCALWQGDEDLHAAQANKLDWHLSSARARNARRLLDVGCGWGSLLNRAVNHFSVQQAVGLSLSEAQSGYIRQASPANVTVHTHGWAEHSLDEPFDAIISIGAFEHFARLDQPQADKLAGYRAFFEFCHRALLPGGRLSLQTITYENADRRDFSAFFAESVFPESDLPHHAEIFGACKGLFEVEHMRNDREHYARTARCWLSALRRSRQRCVELVGRDKVECFEKYLGLLVVGFHTGRMNLARLAMKRIDSMGYG